MSSSSHSHRPAADHAARPRPNHRKSAAAVSRHLHRNPDGYTLTHDGRQIRVGPLAFWIVVGALMIMAVWSVATGSYFAFHQNVLSRLLSRQAAMEIAYEDRIAELRAEIDRITSRQLLDQNEFDKKLNSLLKRQATLEQRTAELGGDALTTGSIRPGHQVPDKHAQTVEPMKPSPIKDTVLFTASPDREARLQSPGVSASQAQTTAGRLNDMLGRVSHSLDQVAHRQIALLNHMEWHYGGKARRMRTVLRDLGIKAQAPPNTAEGGPFIPVTPPGPNASAFARQIYHVNIARAEVERFRRTFATVPVRKPLAGRLEVTSPFGVRPDPFLGTPAMHPGVDLHGERGEPVRATANGTVTVAGWDGGYGNLVEIDHGHGLSTRYGHLSEIDVKLGQKVHRGQVIGKIGSTGRSTGPHLHYETRINGQAVNPEKFLRAGAKIGLL